MSIIEFFRNDQIRCPYCFGETQYTRSIKSCKNRACSKPFPVLYCENYKQFSPFFLQMTGWSQVGKSAYLLALTYVLQKIDAAWPQFTFMAETNETMEYMKEATRIDVDGVVPEPTQMELQEAYIIQMENMPRWGRRTMITRDVAGEAFEKLSFPLQYMPYLMHVPTDLMLIAPTDNNLIWPLMNGFISTLVENKFKFSKTPRRVVTVITKADLLIEDRQDSLKLPAELEKYLREDPFSVRKKMNPVPPDFMNQYMVQLKEMGKIAEDYLASCVPGGRQFISQARSKGIQLDFCVVSSFGSNPQVNTNEGGKTKALVYQFNPMRVLDPLFLAMDQQR